MFIGKNHKTKRLNTFCGFLLLLSILSSNLIYLVPAVAWAGEEEATTTPPLPEVITEPGAPPGETNGGGTLPVPQTTSTDPAIVLDENSLSTSTAVTATTTSNNIATTTGIISEGQPDSSEASTTSGSLISEFTAPLNIDPVESPFETPASTTEISTANAEVLLPENLSLPIVLRYKNKSGETPLEMSVMNPNATSSLYLAASNFLYKDTFANTDLKYEVTEKGVKEWIILKNQNHPAEFKYSLNLGDFDFVEVSPGVIALYKKGEKDNPLAKLYTLSAPKMIDSSGKESSDIAFTINGGLLTLVPSAAWLSTAVYPVMIDPTIEITVLNVHSHPVAGDLWNVDFTTEGAADLTIAPADPETVADMEFTSLYCGEEDRTAGAQILDGDVIFYPSWSCDRVATVSHLDLKTGNHHLVFQFAGAEESVKAEAFNVARVWKGTVSNLWSVAGNWSPAAVPGAADSVTFDNTCTNCDVSIDANVSISSITMASTYTGTITQGAGKTLTLSGTFTLAGGTFQGGDATIDFNGAFSQTGGTFTPTSATTTVAKDFTLSGGTFNGTGRNMAFDGSASGILTCSGDFNSLSGLNSVAVAKGGSAYIFTLSSGCSLTANMSAANGAVTVNNNATLTAAGNWSSFVVINSGTINLPSATTFDINGANGLTNNAGATISYAGTNITDAGNWTQNGTFDLTDKNLTLDGSTSGVFNCTGDFNALTGIGSVTVAKGSSAYSVTLASGCTLAANVSNAVGGVTVSSGSSLTATGNWSSGAVTNNGILTVNGDSWVSTAFTNNATTSLSSAATFDINGNFANSATGTIAYGGTNITAQGNFTYDGDFDLTGKNLTFDGASNGILSFNGDFNAASGVSSVSIAKTSSSYTFTLSTTTILTATTTANLGNLVINGIFTASSNVAAIAFTNNGTTTIPAPFSADINGAFTQTGGSFTAPSSSMTVSGNFTHSGGSFNANNGTVILDGTNQTISGSTTFYNLTKKLTTTAYTLTFGSSATQTILGNLDLEGSGGTVKLALRSSVSGTPWNIDLQGYSTIYFIDVKDSNNINATPINAGPSSTNSGSNTGWDFSALGNLVIWDGGAGTSNWGDALNWDTDTVPVSTSDVKIFNSNVTLAASTTINSLNYGSGGSKTLTINDGVALTVIATTTLVDGSVSTVSSGIISAQGDVVISAAFDGGTAGLTFAGGNNQIFDLTGATNKFNGLVTINKSAGSVALASDFIADAFIQNLVITSGTLDLNGHNLTVNGTGASLRVNSGGTLRLVGSENIVTNNGNPQLNAGSTVVYYGDGGPYTLKSFIYGNLSVIGGGSFTAPAGVMTIAGNFSQSSGTFTASVSTTTVAGDFSRTGGVFDANNGTVSFTGSSQTITGDTTFYNFTKSTSTAASLTFTSASTQTISGTLTLKGTSSARLSLRSSNSGTKWNINPQGAVAVSYLDIKDSNNTGTSINAIGLNVTSSGNNTGWILEPVLSQANYRWFANTDSLDPGSAIAAENSAGTITNTSPVRLRVNLLVSEFDLAASAYAFNLQFSTSTSSGWTTVSDSTLWRFYDNPSVADGAALNSLLLSSQAAGAYAESNPSALNPNGTSAGNYVEYDFALDASHVFANENYYFRVVKADGTLLSSYSNYPVIQYFNAAGNPPDSPASLGPSSVSSGTMASTTNPVFSFVLSDHDASEQLSYHIQISTTPDFTSLVVDYTSALAAAGRASFTVGQAAAGGTYSVGQAGQVLDYGGTYYWRVRSIDAAGNISAYVNATAENISFVTPNQKYWTGLGSDNKWSNKDNWSGGAVPTTIDIAVFNDSCTSNCSAQINTNINVAGIRLETGYTGTITQSAYTTATFGSYTQESGIFRGLGYRVNVKGDFTVTGGTFIAPQDYDFTIQSDYADTSAWMIGGNLTFSGGTISASGSHLSLTGTNTTVLDCNCDFNAVTGVVEVAISKRSADGTLAFKLASGSILTAVMLAYGGDLAIEGHFVTENDDNFKDGLKWYSSATGEVRVSGTLDFTPDSYHGWESGSLVITGGGTVNWTGDGFSAKAASINIVNGTLNATGVDEVNVTNFVKLQGAAAVFNAPELLIFGSQTSFTWADHGVFNHNDGTVKMGDAYSPALIYFSGSTEFYNLENSSNNVDDIVTFSSAEGDVVKVDNRFMMGGGKRLTLQSDVSGTPWDIDLRGTVQMTSVNLKDSNNISPTVTYLGKIGSAGDVAIATDMGGNSGNWDFTDIINPQTVVWSGAAGDGKWSTAANWVGGVVPRMIDVAQFDNTCSSCDAVIDTSVNVAGVTLGATYAGTVTQATGTVVNLGFYERNVSSLDFGTTTSFALYGGTYTMASGTVFSLNDYAHYYNQSVFKNQAMNIYGGTFNGNASGEILLTGADFGIYGGTFNAPSNMEVDGSFTLGGGTVNGTGKNLTFSSNTYEENGAYLYNYGLYCSGDFNSSTGFNVSMYRMGRGFDLGTGCTLTTNVNTEGSISVAAGAVLHATGSTWVSDAVTVEGTVTFDGNEWTSGWLEGVGGGSLTMPNATKFYTDGLELLSGTNFSYGGTDMTLSGWLMLNSGGPYDFSGKNLTLVQDSGREMHLLCVGVLNANSITITGDKRYSYYDYQIEPGCEITAKVDIQAGNDAELDFSIEGTLHIRDSFNVGRSDVWLGSGSSKGTVTAEEGATWKSGTLYMRNGEFDGSNLAVMDVEGDLNNSSVVSSDFKFAKVANLRNSPMAYGTGNINYNGHMYLDQGTVTASSSTINVWGTWWPDSTAATYDFGSSTINFLGPDLIPGGEMALVGDNTFYNLNYNKSASQPLFIDDTTTILNSLSINGTEGDLLHLELLPDSALTSWGINVAEGATVNLSNLYVANSNSTGQVLKGCNLVDGGGNTGWDFTPLDSCGTPSDPGGGEEVTSTDLSLTLSADQSSAKVGDTLTYTLEVKNNGTISATNVSVEITLPAGVTLQSATPSAGSYYGGTWTVGSLNQSAAATLVLTAKVGSSAADSTLNSSASVASTVTDPELSNNTKSVSVQIAAVEEVPIPPTPPAPPAIPAQIGGGSSGRGNQGNPPGQNKPSDQVPTNGSGGLCISFAPAAPFKRTLNLKSKGDDVKVLQEFLNKNGFLVAEEGPGSLGQETDYFGSLTEAAVLKFQARFAAYIKIDGKEGRLDPGTRKFINSLISNTAAPIVWCQVPPVVTPPEPPVVPPVTPPAIIEPPVISEPPVVTEPPVIGVPSTSTVSEIIQEIASGTAEVIGNIAEPVISVISNIPSETLYRLQEAMAMTVKLKAASMDKLAAIQIDPAVSTRVSTLVAAPFILMVQYSIATQNVLLSNIKSFSDLWYMLIGLFQGFLTLIGLRKRRVYWGTVYDSKTKQPIDPAIVDLIDASTGQMVEQSITDLTGRFGFLKKKGEYVINVKKTHYTFPSKIVLGPSDSIFENVYHGETIKISDPNDLIAPNIPMDPLAFDWNQEEKQKVIKFHPKFEFALQLFLSTLFWLGFVLTAFNYISDPNLTNGIFALVYIVLIGFRKFIPDKRLLGKVVSDNVGTDGLLLELSPKQIPQVIVARAITNNSGKFFLKTAAGNYILRIKNKNNDAVLLESEVSVGQERVVNQTFKIH